MAKLYFVKMPNIATGLRYQNGHAQRDRQTNKQKRNAKLSYFRFRVAVRKPISTKLIMDPTPTFWARGPETLGRNDRRAVFRL